MANLTATVTLHAEATDTLPISGTVLTPYGVPCKPPDIQRIYSNGTAANQGTKFYQAKKTATAALSTTDLTAVVCSDGTTGFTHVREIILWNDDATNVITLTTPTNSLLLRFLGGTSPTVILQPGVPWAVPAIPLATTGYLVDSTHKTIDVDPGSNTCIYRILVIGD